jgi:hypothetical protein
LRFPGLLERFRALAGSLKDPPALHWSIEHFQGATAGVDLVVMGEIGEAFEDAKQLLVPGSPPDLHIACPALRAERPEPRELVATLWRGHYGEAAERAHQVKRLALAGLSRILAEPDTDLFAVLLGDIEQQSFDIARVGPRPHHIQQPIAAVLIAAELDADRPIRVVELVLFGGREIPIADDVKVRRGVLDNGTPLALEIQPGGGP